MLGREIITTLVGFLLLHGLGLDTVHRTFEFSGWKVEVQLGQLITECFYVFNFNHDRTISDIS
jgi:hypothetical protein